MLFFSEITTEMCFGSVKVNFPIVVTQLGVFDSNADGLKHGLTTRLYDRISQVCELIIYYCVVGRQITVSYEHLKPNLQVTEKLILILKRLRHRDCTWNFNSHVALHVRALRHIFRVVASMWQTEALAWVISFFFSWYQGCAFLNLANINFLNTSEENLTKDIASIILVMVLMSYVYVSCFEIEMVLSSECGTPYIMCIDV